MTAILLPRRSSSRSLSGLKKAGERDIKFAESDIRRGLVQGPYTAATEGPEERNSFREKWCRVASKRLSLSPGAVPASPARPISTATLAHGAGSSLSGGFFLSHRMPLRRSRGEFFLFAFRLRLSLYLRCLTLCRSTLCSQGKVHGSLARAGKVRGQTPKVAKGEKKKKETGGQRSGCSTTGAL